MGSITARAPSGPVRLCNRIVSKPGQRTCAGQSRTTARSEEGGHHPPEGDGHDHGPHVEGEVPALPCLGEDPVEIELLPQVLKDEQPEAPAGWRPRSWPDRRGFRGQECRFPSGH